MSIPQNPANILTLLETSKMFDDKSKAVIQRAVETSILPTIDQESLIFILKMEKNAHALIDQNTSKLLKELKKKYHQE